MLSRFLMFLKKWDNRDKAGKEKPPRYLHESFTA